MARCLGIDYQEAGGQAVPSYSQKDPGFVDRLEREIGREVYSPGNGWAYFYKTSKLVVRLDSGCDEDSEVDVAPFFKEGWGKLTKHRREAIEEAMPKRLVLTRGGKIGKKSLDLWLLQAKELDTPVVRQKRKKRQERKERVRQRERKTLLRRLDREEREGRERREREEAERKQQAVIRQEELTRLYPNTYLKLRLFSDTHPVSGAPEFTYKRNGVMHVLAWHSAYTPAEGQVYVEVVCDLRPGRRLVRSRS